MMATQLPVPVGSRAISLGAAAAQRAAMDAADAYAEAEKSEATRRAYASDWRHFEAWCMRVETVPLPALPDAVGAYLASLADAGLKASTISRRTAAIAYHHGEAGLPSPTKDKPVKRVGRGIRNTIGSRVNRKAPATDKVLKAMFRKIPDTLAGKRDRALIGLGFAAALRGSELAALAIDDLERVAEGFFVHIRKSKTDQAGEGHSVSVPRGSKLAVVDAVDEWLKASAIKAGPIFRSIDKAGRIGTAPVTRRTIADLIKKYAAAAKLDPIVFSSHSMRAGFVTSALDAGADTLKIMDVTRHRSVETLKIYDRRAKAFQNHAGKGFL